MWRVLRDTDEFSGSAADADAVAQPFRGIGGQRDGAADSEGNDKSGSDKSSSGKSPALQQSPAMCIKTAKRILDHEEDMQESAGVLGVQLVRSRKKMEAMVSSAAKRTQLESKRAATAIFNLAKNKDTDQARTFFYAMRKDMFNTGMSDINATAPAAAANGAVAVRGESACSMSGTAAVSSAAAAASAVASAGDGKDAVIASSDDSDSTTNAADGLGRDKRGSVQRVRLARGRNALVTKAKAGEARIHKTQAAIDLTEPDVAAASSVTAPAARGGTRSCGAGDIARKLGAVSAGTGCAVENEVSDDEKEGRGTVGCPGCAG